MHGANRLASNSLLEALVFSRTAANVMTERLRKERKPLGRQPLKKSIEGKALPHGYRSQIREILQDTYFVLPKPEKAEESYNKVEQILSELVSDDFAITPDYVEARSIAIVASIILEEFKEGIK